MLCQAKNVSEKNKQGLVMMTYQLIIYTSFFLIISLMDAAFAVISIFLLNTCLLLFFALKRPYITFFKLRLESYAWVVLTGPIILLFSGLMSLKQMGGGIARHGSVDPLGILILFLSMVFISIFLDNVGFMEYCARLALRFAGHSGRVLFFSLYFTVSVLTVFTSNDIIILTFTPFIYYFAKNAGIDPKPYLLAEFFAANTWSMMLQIGNPTNIFITTALDIKFFEYFKWMFLPTLIGGLVSLLVIYLLFRKEINRKITPVKDDNPSDAIRDKTEAVIGVGILVLCTIGLSIAPYYGISMWRVSLFFAILLAGIILVKDSAKFLKWDYKTISIRPVLARMPWSIVIFVLSFFVMVHALEIHGVTSGIGSFLNKEGLSTAHHIFVYGIGSALSANLLNNIPMSVAFTSIISGLSGVALLAAGFAVTIGSNLGANITPIGALAGIMWMNILRDKKIDISYRRFIYYGVIVTIFTLLVTLGVLALEFYMTG